MIYNEKGTVIKAASDICFDHIISSIVFSVPNNEKVCFDNSLSKKLVTLFDINTGTTSQYVELNDTIVLEVTDTGHLLCLVQSNIDSYDLVEKLPDDKNIIIKENIQNASYYNGKIYMLYYEGNKTMLKIDDYTPKQP